MTSLSQTEIESCLQKAFSLLSNYADTTPCYCEMGITNTHSVVVRRTDNNKPPEWRLINYDNYESSHAFFTRGYMHIFVPKNILTSSVREWPHCLH